MFNEIITKDEVKFNELEKKIFKFVCFLGCMLIKLFLERYDEKLKKTRDKIKYRDKGHRQNTVKTVMGPVTYKRTMYIENENGKLRTMFLLDETLKICTIGKVSQNLAERAVEVVVNSTSYRKASENIENMTNESISHEELRRLTLEIGNKIEQKENEEIKLMKTDQLVKGLKEITALFEEADGIWVNLQGKDRQIALEKQKKQCEKKNRKFNPKGKVKTEVKLHLTYEGWKKGDNRHSLVNKRYMAGIMNPKRIRELRDARVYQMYNVDKIELRVTNGDGAAWTKGITAKGGIYQKDNFHIHQEITRDVPKEYRYLIEDLLDKKEYTKIPEMIERLKYEVNGEEKAIKRLKILKSYLRQDLERYQDIIKKQGKELPKAPDGIEYRNMGTQESQIFSKLKVRLCSGRKSFSKYGANLLAKVCVWIGEKEEWYEDLEEPIPMDTSVKDWIEEIESNIVKKKRDVGLYNNFKDIDNFKTSRLTNVSKFLKDMLTELSFSDMRCSY